MCVIVVFDVLYALQRTSKRVKRIPAQAARQGRCHGNENRLQACHVSKKVKSPPLYGNHLPKPGTLIGKKITRTGRGVRGAVDPPIRADLTPQFGQIRRSFGQKTTHLFD